MDELTVVLDLCVTNYHSDKAQQHAAVHCSGGITQRRELFLAEMGEELKQNTHFT